MLPSLSKLKFQGEFRLYQKQILEKVKLDVSDKRFHIVAPPGSGKTIVGIELIRRIGSKAVVFVPNTTIQLQWKKQVELFLAPEDKKLINEIVSLDPKHLKLINVFTYQLISTPDQNNEYLESSAILFWENLLIEQRKKTPQEAKRHIRELKKENRLLYSDEIAKYKHEVKKNLLSTNKSDVESFLHSNARKLINDLVSGGVQTVVLDEVHHLLDYWALTIKALTRKIKKESVIGLTATPPYSATLQEKENYLGILGDIDYEIPTPAVVKEGNLAPYQDLLYLCQPDVKEKEFINNIQLHFENFINSLSKDELFKNYLIETVDREIKIHTWQAFFKKNPALSVAIIKAMMINKIKIQKEVIILPEMKRDLNLDDWSILLKSYSLDYLKLSSEPEKIQTLEKIKAILRMFGYSLTEEGITDYRSPSDLILSYSQSKTNSVVEILKTEMESMQDRLRAVVITDFEKMNVAAKKRVNDVLDKEAGGAVGVFKAITHDKDTTKLEAILISGENVLIDPDEIKIIVSACEEWRKKHGYEFVLKTIDTEYENIKQLIGEGKDWKTSVYVQMVTDLLENGITKCIVGTRGLIGEGWNCISVNTLIDMTCVTSSSTTNQIMGRSLRLDPNWPEKLANIWYVVCLDTTFEKGDQDLKRIIKKYKQFYGIDEQGKIVKGIAHVDSSLTFTLLTKGFKQIPQSLISKEMLNKAKKRNRVRELWKIGQPYKNIELSGLSMSQSQLKIKTSYTLRETAQSLTFTLYESLFGIFIWYYNNLRQIYNNPIFGGISLQIQQAGAVMLTVVVLGHSGYRLKKIYQKVTTQIPVDAYVKDIVVAVVETLKDEELIDNKIDSKNIVVSSGVKGRLNIDMKDVDGFNSQIINNAISDVFSPILDQRYLVERSLNRLPLGIFSPIWWIIHFSLKIFGLVKPTFHPVPDILAVNKRRAKNFSHFWKKYVGGGKLIYTRTFNGGKDLLYLRQTSNQEFDKMTYETWQ